MKPKDNAEKKNILDDLACMLLYDKQSGLLFWNISPRPGINPGDRVSRHIPVKGHLQIEFRGNYFQQHRVIFYMMHGYLPDVVDHIDGNKTNNKIDNLRPSNDLTNARNKRIGSRNSSGYKGIIRRKSKDDWIARIGVNGKQVHIGIFKNKHIAAHEYNKAAIKYHGEFATLNPVEGFFV